MSHGAGNKVIVFARHLAVLDHIEQELGTEHSTVRIDGGTSPSTRNRRVDQFQKDPSVKLAILSLTAAGVRPFYHCLRPWAVLLLTAAGIDPTIIWDPWCWPPPPSSSTDAPGGSGVAATLTVMMGRTPIFVPKSQNLLVGY